MPACGEPVGRYRRREPCQNPRQGYWHGLAELPRIVFQPAPNLSACTKRMIRDAATPTQSFVLEQFRHKATGHTRLQISALFSDSNHQSSSWAFSLTLEWLGRWRCQIAGSISVSLYLNGPEGIGLPLTFSLSVGAQTPQRFSALMAF